jgi:phosphomevalonate kinase
MGMGWVSQLILTAPGKLFLFGEYAVLSGLPALLTTVPVFGYYRGPVSPGGFFSLYPGSPTTPLPREGTGILDTRSFYRGRRKLGFGSSAVYAVLKAGALLWGRWEKKALFQKAIAIHQEEVGPTSGADLLAILSGGVGISIPHEGIFSPFVFPEGIEMIVVEEEVSADSRLWISRYREKEGGREVQDWLKKVADWFRTAKNSGLSLELFGEAVELYASLEGILGGELYPPRFRYFRELAKSLRIPFKPSGAGGGDLGIFFTPEGRREELFASLKKARIPMRRLSPSLAGLIGWETSPWNRR